jgi:hypothetical protein
MDNDNLACHKTAKVVRLVLVNAAGAEVRYLAAYSPDLNPIERMFSTFKAWLKAKARTVDTLIHLIHAMGEVLRAIQPDDISGWFGHSGYRLTTPTGTTTGKPV